jgi:RNase P subunit RPR2
MSQDHSLPVRVQPTIHRPACPACHAYMMLARIMPARLGIDIRTFECPQCDQVHEMMVANATFSDPFTPPA